METLRKSYVALALFGPLVVANGVATLKAKFRARIMNAQLVLQDTGTGAGNTTVAVNINGVAVTPSGGLSIAGAASGKEVDADITKGSNYYPGGALVNPDDVITVDITAVPAATAPKGGMVILTLVQVDA